MAHIFNHRAYYHFYSFFTYHFLITLRFQVFRRYSKRVSYKSIIKLTKRKVLSILWQLGLNMPDWWTWYKPLTPLMDIWSAKEMTGGSSDAEFMRINQFYMETSRRTWPNIIKDSRQLVRNRAREYLGVYVLTVTDTNFKGILNIADTVTAVNDKTFWRLKEMVDYANSQTLGDKVKVTTKRMGGKNSWKENHYSGNGKTVSESVWLTARKCQVMCQSFSTAGIGGPSWPCLACLFITKLQTQPFEMDGLLPVQGSIDRDGNVGDIGGIDLKVVAAAKRSYRNFAPNNPITEEAKKANPKRQVLWHVRRSCWND